MLPVFLTFFAVVLNDPALESARDRQDKAAIATIVAELNGNAAKSPNDANAQYKLAAAQSLLAGVASELRDNGLAESASEAGIKAAERAVALKPDVAEYHRILATLCGQLIPANKLLGLKYGRCALDSINKAIQMDPKLAMAYVTRGVGNYYLPPMFGGSVDNAIKDFQKAIELDPKLTDAHLWLGLAYRKLNRNGEARTALSKALQLSPKRVWVKQQLDKTPVK